MQGGKRAKGKGKEKRSREEDKPDTTSSIGVSKQYANVLKLQKHLYCHAHSRGGMKVYCRIEEGSKTSEGGHREVNHAQMTLWAKQLVSKIPLLIRKRLTRSSQSIEGSDVTLSRPPNLKAFDYPPTKKPRASRATQPTPEVHIALKISSVPGSPFQVEGSQGSYGFSAGPTSAPAVSCPAKLEDVSGAVSNLEPHLGSYRLRGSPTGPSLIPTLVECLRSERVPTTRELLKLMDMYNPVEDLKYSDVSSELYDHGIEDALDISSMPAEILATLGYLGRSGAAALHRYIRDSILTPLGLLETQSKVEDVVDDAVAVEVITVSDDSVELVPKVEDPAELLPKVEEGVIEMAAELEMGHDTGYRQPYSEFQQVHAILRWQEAVSGEADGFDEIEDAEDEDVDEIDEDVDEIEEDDEGGDVASMVSSHEV